MSVVDVFAYVRLDSDLYRAPEGATRVLVGYGRDCLPPAGTEESQGSRGPPGCTWARGRGTQLVLTPAWDDCWILTIAPASLPPTWEDAQPLPFFELLQDRIRLATCVSTLWLGNWPLNPQSQFLRCWTQLDTKVKQMYFSHSGPQDQLILSPVLG